MRDKLRFVTVKDWLVPAILIAAYLFVGFIFVAYGRTNIDEGIFLNAGRLAADGQLPYRDFPFSQAPMLPYAYAGAFPVLESTIIGGRLISFLAAALGMGATLWFTRKLAGNLAALLTLGLFLANLPSLWVGMTVRAQSIGTPLLILSVAALALPRSTARSWAIAPSFALWATGMRLTSVGVLAAMLVWVAWQLRDSPSRLRRVALIVAGQAMIVFAPALIAPGDSFFHVITAQWSRSDRFGTEAHTLLSSALIKAEIYLDLALDAPLTVLLGLAVLGGLALRWARGWRPSWAQPMGDPLSAQFTLMGLAALAFVPHLALTRGYLTYLIPLWALMTPAVGIGVARWLNSNGRRAGARPWVVAALIAWVTLNATLHWNTWIGTEAGSFAAFRSTARQLARLGGEDCTMLTFQLDLAVEAGCRPLPGLEYSYFSYFGKMSSEEARQRGVLNAELLREKVAEVRPRLIVVGRRELQMLRTAVRAQGGPLGPAARDLESKPPDVEHPLDFLGPSRGAYRLDQRTNLASGIRRPGAPDTIPLMIFQRTGAGSEVKSR